MDDDVSKALELKHRTASDYSTDTVVERNTLAINRLTKASLYSFVGFLAVTALLAIGSVLSGNFGEFEIKVLATTSVIAVASICSLCCSAYSARSTTLLPGLGGILLAGLAAALLILSIWSETHAENYWKTTAVLSVLAIACAHALALLSVRLRPAHLWIRIATGVTILILAIVISGMIVGEVDDKGTAKLVAILAILAALETLVIPILGRLSKGQLEPLPRTLVLTEMQDGRYQDRGGRIYEVHSVSNYSVEDVDSRAV